MGGHETVERFGRTTDVIDVLLPMLHVYLCANDSTFGVYRDLEVLTRVLTHHAGHLDDDAFCGARLAFRPGRPSLWDLAGMCDSRKIAAAAGCEVARGQE